MGKPSYFIRDLNKNLYGRKEETKENLDDVKDIIEMHQRTSVIGRQSFFITLKEKLKNVFKKN